tara:strand:- start:320 stop:709 length:390 start_codon:yes stop_codon:yes gene_type:complete
MATSYDINLTRGNDFSVRLAVKDDAGSAYNLTGYTASGVVRNKYSDTGYLVDLNAKVVSGVNGAGYVSGFIDLYLSGNQTTGVPVTQGVYDVEIYSGTYHQKVILGQANIYPEVTRPFGSSYTQEGSYQ